MMYGLNLWSDNWKVHIIMKFCVPMLNLHFIILKLSLMVTRKWTLNWDYVTDDIIVGSCPRSPEDLVRGFS